jgi:hypothetical protein
MATTELADLREDPGDRWRRKQVSQPMQPSQGGAGCSTAEERRLSQRAPSQGREAGPSRAEQGEAGFTGQQLSGIPISQEISPFSP